MAEEETKRGSRTAAQESDEESGRARADEPAGGREDDERPESHEADEPAGGREDDERPESHEADEPAGGREENGGGDREEQQVSAPSLSPKTTIAREPAEERLARHER